MLSIATDTPWNAVAGFVSLAGEQCNLKTVMQQQA